MKWFIKRVLIIGFVLSIVCMLVVVLARLAHLPTKLQTLGLDICDGDPCFRGLKPGADWVTVQKMFPNAVRSDNGSLLQIDNVGELPTVLIYPSPDNKTIDGIVLPSYEFDPPQPFTLADVIAQYGPPCRVLMNYADTGPYFLSMGYPKMSLSVETQLNDATGELYDSHRLQWTYPVKSFSIGGEPQQGGCNAAISENVSWWYGFTSEEEYHRRTLRDLGVTQP